MSSEFGNILRVSVFGQSHGKAIGVVVDGLPAGEAIDLEELQRFLDRRRPGTGPLSTTRKETDVPEFLSGLEGGKTCGAPLCAVIKNADQHSKDYGELADKPRPGHADFTAWAKWGGHADMRGGGHFSGRLTAPLCVAGGIAKQILARRGIFVGAHLANYDSLLVLSHFKGHPMGGFGGALKNISIGIASSRGKQYIHGAGDMDKFWDADHDSFLEAMADAAWSVHDHFKGKAAYLNIMKNMSVDCDCCAVAADPKIGDIGILASLDPVALDQACLDLVYASDDPGKADLIERIESLHGVHTVEAAADLGIGTREYELITLD